MKKAIKRILIFAAILSLCLGLFSLDTLAASATVKFSKQNASVGDTLTVTVTVSAPDMYGVDIRGSYNEQVLTLVTSGVIEGGAGLFTITDSQSFNGESSKSFELTFKAKAAGSSSISVSGLVASGIPPEDVEVSASATLNVSDVTKSNNANLSSLRVGAGSLSPKFSPNITEYTVNVKKSVTECLVYGVTADKGASFVVEGSKNLKIGTNTRVIIVTAPSGAQKKYTLTIIRSDEEDEVSSAPAISPALETIIDGVSYTVLPDISGVELPVGFNVAKRLYNNEEVSVAIDEKENFELYYLKASDSETAFPYIYDSEKNTFKKVQIIIQGSNSYIVSEIPASLTVPEEFTTKNVTIQDMTISAYISPDTALEEMYYLYCYFGGEFSMYRYDSVENVLQRCPEFVLLSAEAKDTGVLDFELLNRFNSLSANAKTIVVCLLIAFVGVIALMVLIIIKMIKNSKGEDFDLEDEAEDFDTVQFNDDFQIISDESDDE